MEDCSNMTSIARPPNDTTFLAELPSKLFLSLTPPSSPRNHDSNPLLNSPNLISHINTVSVPPIPPLSISPININSQQAAPTSAHQVLFSDPILQQASSHQLLLAKSNKFRSDSEPVMTAAEINSSKNKIKWSVPKNTFSKKSETVTGSPPNEESNSHSSLQKTKSKFNSLIGAMKKKPPEEQVHISNEAPLPTPEQIEIKYHVLNPIFEPRQSLVQLLASNQYCLLNTLCEIVDVWHHDELAKAVLSVFGTTRQIESLITWAVTTEIQSTKDTENLFRGAGIRISLISYYINKEGFSYLQRTLKPHILEILHSASNRSIELDPDKLGPGEDIEANRQHITAICTALLESLLTSVDEFPSTLRSLFDWSRKKLTNSYPVPPSSSSSSTSSPAAASWHILIASLFFLRFVCPAFVTPDSCSLILEVPQPKARRMLVLVSKIIQSISNSVGSDDPISMDKEAYMRPFHDFILSYRSAMINFFDQLSTVNEKPLFWIEHKKSVDKWPSQYHNMTSEADPVGCINNHLLQNCNKMTDKLSSQTTQVQKLKNYTSKVKQQQLLDLRSIQSDEPYSVGIAPSPRGQKARTSNNTNNSITSSKSKFAQPLCLSANNPADLQTSKIKDNIFSTPNLHSLFGNDFLEHILREKEVHIEPGSTDEESDGFLSEEDADVREVDGQCLRSKSSNLALHSSSSSSSSSANGSQNPLMTSSSYPNESPLQNPHKENIPTAWSQEQLISNNPNNQRPTRPFHSEKDMSKFVQKNPKSQRPKTPKQLSSSSSSSSSSSLKQKRGNLTLPRPPDRGRVATVVVNFEESTASQNQTNSQNLQNHQVNTKPMTLQEPRKASSNLVTRRRSREPIANLELNTIFHLEEEIKNLRSSKESLQAKYEQLLSSYESLLLNRCVCGGTTPSTLPSCSSSSSGSIP